MTAVDGFWTLAVLGVLFELFLVTAWLVEAVRGDDDERQSGKGW